jgi:ABC-type transporter Mla subunit MlaD
MPKGHGHVYAIVWMFVGFVICLVCGVIYLLASFFFTLFTPSLVYNMDRNK